MVLRCARTGTKCTVSFDSSLACHRETITDDKQGGGVCMISDGSEGGGPGNEETAHLAVYHKQVL